ncbi:inositol polyphosphate multikinase-like isoform X1 [Haliotis rubra]|uniref:inositol polyphosphate multikinase-like isoform X1 n=1 Tax=Haliotis rubra TaxID=36100 RepID=UPI001EE5A031|nr:inositol polyphosphate multikinase-like isoform X1 [Haliotis rubra]
MQQGCQYFALGNVAYGKYSTKYEYNYQLTGRTTQHADRGYTGDQETMLLSTGTNVQHGAYKPDNDEDQSQVTVTSFTLQVAGHVYGKKDKKQGKPGMLHLGRGMILKALQDPPRGTRELQFYQQVFSPTNTDEVTIALRRFMPAYHGTMEFDGVGFLKLENIVEHYKQPCIADVKMGKVTSDPHATPEKAAYEKSKCPSAAVLGFQISGMLIYQPDTGQYERVDKVAGHKLTTDNMISEGIGKFFGYPKSIRKDVIEILLSKLVDLQYWFTSQRQYSFYGSSLLIVYEALICDKHKHPASSKTSSPSQSTTSDDKVSTTSKHQGSSEPNCQSAACLKKLPTIDVRMIDFAHVFPTPVEDRNYLDGLTNLIQHLRLLLDFKS